MSRTIRVQMDGNGNFIEPDQPSAVETAAEYQERRERESSGIAINPHKHKMRLQGGFDPEQAAAQGRKDAQRMAEELVNTVDRIQRQADGGMEPNNAQLERLQHRLDDIFLAHTAGGGSSDDEALVRLRQYVADASANIRLNRR